MKIKFKKELSSNLIHSGRAAHPPQAEGFNSNLIPEMKPRSTALKLKIEFNPPSCRKD